jgi:hypothetical protein
MRFLSIKSISVILILGSIFLSGSGSADLVDKEPYIVPSKIKYKENLNIVILPFSGELSEERKYFNDLIRNYLGDNILLYKKIRFPYTLIDFKTYGFSSSGKETKKSDISAESGGNKVKDEGKKDHFFELKLIEDKTISEGKIFNSLVPGDIPDVKGKDIFVTGEIKQELNNLKIRIKVTNEIYGKDFLIEKEGTFKNIDQLLETLFKEVIKSIIAKYSYLNISSNEKNAAIYIDGRYFGRTDKSAIILESGSHKISLIKADHTEKITTVTLPEKSTESLRIDFDTKDISSINSIKITTDPDNAKVYIDSDFTGISPVVKSYMTPGSYRIRIEKEGYITKYQTIVIGGKEDRDRNDNVIQDLSFKLENGDSKEYYFSRTSAYNNLFICSSFGIVLSSASYLYFGLKVNDQNARLKNLSTGDPDYAAKKDKIEDRKDKYKLCQQISLFTAGAMIISAGIFYYLDKAQYDINIAFYLPQNYYSDKAFKSSYSLMAPIEKGAGIIFTKSF